MQCKIYTFQKQNRKGVCTVTDLKLKLELKSFLYFAAERYVDISQPQCQQILRYWIEHDNIRENQQAEHVLIR